MLNIEEIKQIIPHRYPFLLIDRVEEMEVGKSVHAVKCITASEPWFTGHFPDHNVMPGVLLVEAIKNAKFRREVVPGDKLDIHVEITKMRRNFGSGAGKIYCGQDLCVEAEISFFIEK